MNSPAVCPLCRRPLPAGTGACPDCAAAELPWWVDAAPPVPAPPVPAPPAAPPPAHPAPPTPPTRRGLALASTAAGLAALLALGGGLLWLCLASDGDQPPLAQAPGPAPPGNSAASDKGSGGAKDTAKSGKPPAPGPQATAKGAPAPEPGDFIGPPRPPRDEPPPKKDEPPGKGDEPPPRD